MSERGPNLPSSNSSRKPPPRQLNTSPQQPAAPRVLLQGDLGRLGQLPPGEMLAIEPLQQPWTLLHGAPARAAAWGLPCPCCTVKPWEESGVHCPPLQNQTQQSPGKPQKEYPVAKISRSAYLLLPGKGVGALRALLTIFITRSREISSPYENLPLCYA